MSAEDLKPETIGSRLARTLNARGIILKRHVKDVTAALDFEFDRVLIPDFETTVRMVAANIHGQGKFYIEIGVDPETKEVGWTFEPDVIRSLVARNARLKKRNTRLRLCVNKLREERDDADNYVRAIWKRNQLPSPMSDRLYNRLTK